MLSINAIVDLGSFESEKLGHLLILELLFLLDEVSADVLLRKPIDNSINATRVNMFGTRLSL